MRELTLGARDLLRSYFWDNPIFLKDLRLHFRSARTYWVQGIYLLVVGVCLAGLTSYVQIAAQAGGRSALWAVGQTIFRGLFALHVLLVTVLLSSVAAGAVTGEREARTFELLDSLPLSKGRLIAGKFAALVLLTGLFIVSAMPMLMVSLQLIGGVTSTDVLAAFLTLLGVVGVTAALGVLASCVSGGYRSAIFLCYRVLFLAVLLGWAIKAYGFYAATAEAYGGRGGVTAWGGTYLMQQLMLQQRAGGIPAVALLVWPINLLIALIPTPTTTKGAAVVFALCLGAMGPMLTGAAESLRPLYEKKPYQVLLQMFLLLHLVLGGFLLASAASSARAPAPSPYAGGGATAMRVVVSPTGVRTIVPVTPASQLPGLDFLLLEATALLLFSVCVLPAESKGFSGWRALFSGGPAQGALLLGLCVLSSYMLWNLLTPELLSAAAAGGGAATAFSVVRSGQLLLLLLVPLWAALSLLARKTFPKHSRQAYFGLQLLLTVGPLVANSFLPEGLRRLNASLLSLNPWLLLSTLDAGRGEALSRTLHLPPLPPGAQVAAVALATAAAAWGLSVVGARAKGT